MAGNSNSNQSGKSKNWYKIATITLSAMVVIIMFITGIYFRNHDVKAKNVAKIEQMIEKLLNQKKNIEETPTISISLLTLENSGLPSSAFKDLDAVPAVIRLEHLSGETAQGISVSIKSYAKILKFVPEDTVEEFSHALSDDGYSLKIDIPKLRRDSKLQGTIMCERVSTMKSDIRIDTGVTIEELESRSTKIKDNRYQTLDDLNKIDPRGFFTVNQIESSIDDLRVMIQRERGDVKNNETSFLSSFLKSFIPITGLALLFPILSLIINRHVDRKVGAVGNESGNCIGNAIKQQNIKYGTTKDEVTDLIGSPKKTTVVVDSDETLDQWYYEPKASKAYGWQPDLTLRFQNNKVCHIELVEYGDRSYS